MSGKVSAMHVFEPKSLRLARTALLALLVAAPLAGCAMDDLEADDTFAAYRMEDRYPIEVTREPVTMEVSTRNGSLSLSQINAVSALARQTASGNPAPVTISKPSGGGGKVAGEIASVFAAQGLPKSMIRMSSYSGPASAPVRITVVKTMAMTKPCGNWSDNVTETGSNQHFANHGCAVRANMAAMVADPNDFVAPGPMSPSPAPSRSAAVRKINEGQSTNTFSRSIFSLF